jgi:hypothetical protein
LLDIVSRDFYTFFVVFLPRECLRPKSGGEILVARKAKAFLLRTLQIVLFVDAV